ncbi:DNA topoisomerase I [Coemansia reversa NRRL 1564]|uniref:DNA topoisomerase I n=1 Tax=Coemansia reversa (strain ATCC 12441 / NRRL 1564) TaxID=763665 RepID=A0A2G5BD55_COERN|nr:DNA topoisomerase I [Coemansia reversa NRRL 1564]|eukprot:PIA16948.1 DNA topoisomerase I [Coemansia reversa NRRL 1564]
MSTSESDDGAPLSKRVVGGMTVGGLSINSAAGDTTSSDDDRDDVPLAKRNRVASSRNKRKSDSSSDSESDQPLSNKVKAPKANTNGKSPGSEARKRRKAQQTTDKKPNGAAKAVSNKPRVKKEAGVSSKSIKNSTGISAGVDRKPLIKTEPSVANGSEASDEDYKWWLENKDDEGPKWQTLEHNGVLFPPDYVPHGLPLVYKGAEIIMPPEVEEVATFFAALVGTDHGVNPVFQSNFFNDFKDLLNLHMPKCPIKEFKHCDFSRIRGHLDEQSAKRKTMTKAEKEAQKKERQQLEEKYEFCILDGRREKVGNFRIEPPGLFRGRGAHPKTGKLKKRVLPEQVTINIGKTALIPTPPPGHKWGSVQHDDTVTWLATWRENVNGSAKYVFLAANSSLKGQSDLRKYEKARSLVHSIDAIRKQYTVELKSSVMAERQRASALYLIDRYALRAGNEKGDDEADTVGCCSLRCEHVKLEPPNIVHFDFLGKDSIRYQRTTEIDRQVWKNLRLFQRGPPKTSTDMLFDRLSTSTLNKHLQTLMPGLTAKVFRTFNASYVFQQQLKNTPSEGTEAEKILAYNRANREVAVLCNHQRSVSKGFEGQMTRIEDRLLAVRYQRMLLKNYVLSVAPALKKKHPELKEKEEGVTSKWIKQYLLSTCELDREKVKKKFERDNEKLKESGEAQIPELKLKEQLAAIDIREKSIKNGTYEAELPVAKNATTDKMLEKLEKLNQRVRNIEVDMIEKDENKTTALSTSKLNYIDPRISIAWCKKYNVPIEKIFNKTLREKFTWALGVDSEWTF